MNTTTLTLLYLVIFLSCCYISFKFFSGQWHTKWQATGCRYRFDSERTYGDSLPEIAKNVIIDLIDYAPGEASFDMLCEMLEQEDHPLYKHYEWNIRSQWVCLKLVSGKGDIIQVTTIGELCLLFSDAQIRYDKLRDCAYIVEV